MTLTATWLKANYKKPRPKALEKADRDGLSARLSPKGKVTYTLRYLYKGTGQRVDIGSYPLMSLKEARDEAQRLRKELEQGHSPKVVRQLEKKEIMEAASVERLFNDWYKAYCIGNKKGHAEILRSFKLHVFPKIGKLPANQVTLHEWLDILEPLAKEKPGISERILVNAKQMLKWGVKRQLLPSNPLSDINAKADLQIKKGMDTRNLSDEEIKMLLLALEKSRMALKNKVFLKLCLIYGCRGGELRIAEKEHFDFEAMVWTIPPENHKIGATTGKPLLRPITPEIKEILDDVFAICPDSKYVFTNTGSNECFGRSAPLALPYNIMQWLRRHADYDMEHWSVHALRKTARTNFSKITEPHVAEILLGHRLPNSWQVYDHYDYLKEQKNVIERWWDRLENISNSMYKS